ncbi:MAG: hypothetical protein S0880_18195 [Actinomycetota bacterium]|nr:hypothetical protein [Actinomycetota bacterium]
MERDELVRRIHDSPTAAVLAITGGGVAAASDLLGMPGASRTVLELIVPYSQASLDDWVGAPVTGATSVDTAQRMAAASLARAHALVSATGEAPPIVGLGVTAALATDRPKRGDHRAHLALRGPGGLGRTWSITLAKGERTRTEEDRLVADLTLRLLGEGCGIASTFDPTGAPADVALLAADVFRPEPA